jgi:hypothetical protein
MRAIKTPDQKAGRLVVVNSETDSKGTAGDGGCLPVKGSPGILVKASRIAGYGFIFLSLMVGVIAVIGLAMGGILMLPSLVSTLKRVRARYYSSSPRMVR